MRVTDDVGDRDRLSEPVSLTVGVPVEVLLALTPGDRDVVGDAVIEGVALIEGVTVAVGVEALDGDSDAVPVAEGVAVPDLVADGVAVGVADADIPGERGIPVLVEDGVSDCVCVGVVVARLLPELVADGVVEGVMVDDGDGIGDDDGVGVFDGVEEAVDPVERDTVGDAVIDAVADIVDDGVGDSDTCSDSVLDVDGVGVSVDEGVEADVPVGDGDTEAVSVPDWLSEPVEDGVREGEEPWERLDEVVAVTEGVGVEVAVAEDELVEDADGVPEREDVGVSVGVSEGVREGDAEDESDTDPESEPVLDGDTPRVRDEVAEKVAVVEGVPDGVIDDVEVGVTEDDGEVVTAAVPVPVMDGVGDADGVDESDKVGVPLGVLEPVAPRERDDVGV